MRKVQSVLPAALMALLLAACGSCGSTPYKRIANAQRSLDHIARFGETIDGAIKNFAEAEDARCTAAHKPKTTEYGECVRPSLKVLWAWTGEKMGAKTGKGALPILQGAQFAARNAVNAAHDYVTSHEDECAKKEGPPAKCSADWKAGIKPSLCAAWELANVAVKIGAYKANTPAYKTVAGLAALLCGGGS